jgi:septum site-determining protein MinC
MAAAVPKPNLPPAVFDLKGATLSVVAVVLRSADLAELEQALHARFADAPELFDGDPVVVDLSTLRDDDARIDFDALVALLRRFRMAPVAVRAGSLTQMADAHAAGLAEAPDGPAARAQTPPVLHEVIIERAPAPKAEPVPAPRALVIDKPLRAGQQVYARGADAIILAAVNPGAEVIADGNVHVYAPLRGRAVAGASGDSGARIFSTCMQPQLVSIAGYYRTSDTGWPVELHARPAQIRLDGERIVVEPLER